MRLVIHIGDLTSESQIEYTMNYCNTVSYIKTFGSSIINSICIYTNRILQYTPPNSNFNYDCLTSNSNLLFCSAPPSPHHHPPPTPIFANNGVFYQWEAQIREIKKKGAFFSGMSPRDFGKGWPCSMYLFPFVCSACLNCYAPGHWKWHLVGENACKISSWNQSAHVCSVSLVLDKCVEWHQKLGYRYEIRIEMGDLWTILCGSLGPGAQRVSQPGNFTMVAVILLELHPE